jgi:hypothetical protein
VPIESTLCGLGNNIIKAIQSTPLVLMKLALQACLIFPQNYLISRRSLVPVHFEPLSSDSFVPARALHTADDVLSQRADRRMGMPNATFTVAF